MRNVNLEEAVSVVKSGERVYVHGGSATPEVLIEGLLELRPDLRGVEIVHMHTNGPARYVEPEYEGRFRHNALFIGPNVRAAVNEGRADYTPVFLSDIPRLFAPGGVLPLDVALLHLSVPDEQGYCSFGTSVDCAVAAAANARMVIAQVNRQMPCSFGARIHVDDIDYAVEIDEPLLEAQHAPPGEEALAIGREVASLIADGSTLQMGIGAVPDAVLAQLGGHRDLGVHTEMFSDGLLPLIRAGVVNGARKTVDPGRVVSAFVSGSRDLYRFIDGNAGVELRPVSYTNDVAVIAAQERMIAINSALSVDLTGQVVADSIGPVFYSGIGGQVDFIRGAARSRGGVPVIALPATAKDGAISRIVSQLAPGAGVVTTRGDVHWVATEYGKANLHGKTIRERVRMMIGLAAPAYREGLEREARQLRYLGG